MDPATSKGVASKTHRLQKAEALLPLSKTFLPVRAGEDTSQRAASVFIDPTPSSRFPAAQEVDFRPETLYFVQKVERHFDRREIQAACDAQTLHPA